MIELGRSIAGTNYVRYLALSMCLLVACDDSPGGGPGVTSKIGTFEFPRAGRPSLDLLFVIDDGPAMATHRDQLLLHYPEIADILAAVPNGQPDLQIAVATADPANGGALRTVPSVAGPFLIDGMRDGVRVQNYTGSLGAAITAMLDAGTAGTSSPHPLDVIRLAWDQNPTFVRDSSFLAVVVISAGDDASGVDVAALATALKSRRIDPQSMMVIGIYPRPAAVLDGFLAQFPYRNSWTAIDAADPLQGLGELITSYRVTLGAACLGWTPLDVDPDMEGAQYDCVVVEAVAKPGGEETLLPRCGSEQPCWDFEPDPMICTEAPRLKFKVDRGSAGAPYEPTIVKGQCLIE